MEYLSEIILPVAVLWLLPLPFAIWIYRDAESRSMPGAVWLLIVLVSGPIGFMIYFWVRPKTQTYIEIRRGPLNFKNLLLIMGVILNVAPFLPYFWLSPDQYSLPFLINGQGIVMIVMAVKMHRDQTKMKHLEELAS